MNKRRIVVAVVCGVVGIAVLVTGLVLDAGGTRGASWPLNSLASMGVSCGITIAVLPFAIFWLTRHEK